MSESPAPAQASPSRPNPRAAALAAAEARLRPLNPISTESQSSSSSTTPQQPSSSSGVPKRPASNTGVTSPETGESGTGNTPKRWEPTEKEDRDTKIKFARALDRGLVRDNGYRQVAECVETLITISRNILNNDDPKYRTLKASNSLLKNKVLLLKGGHDYLITLGFRVQTVDFNQQYVFTATLKRIHELKMGTEVLEDHLSELRLRASNATYAAQAHKSAEASRVAQALAEIDADREKVKERLAREKIMRDREERLKREQKEKAASEEEELERRREEAASGGGVGGMTVESGLDHGQGEEDDEDEDYEDDREGMGTWGGQGHRL